MITLESNIYCPVNPGKDTNDLKVGYVISSSQKEVRTRFVNIMNTPWKKLYQQGWRIERVELIADERDIYPEEFPYDY